MAPECFWCQVSYNRPSMTVLASKRVGMPSVGQFLQLTFLLSPNSIKTADKPSADSLFVIYPLSSAQRGATRQARSPSQSMGQ